jgi:hypothetical protein
MSVATTPSYRVMIFVASALRCCISHFANGFRRQIEFLMHLKNQDCAYLLWLYRTKDGL